MPQKRKAQKAALNREAAKRNAKIYPEPENVDQLSDSDSDVENPVIEDDVFDQPAEHHSASNNFSTSAIQDVVDDFASEEWEMANDLDWCDTIRGIQQPFQSSLNSTMFFEEQWDLEWCNTTREIQQPFQSSLNSIMFFEEPGNLDLSEIPLLTSEPAVPLEISTSTTAMEPSFFSGCSFFNHEAPKPELSSADASSTFNECIQPFDYSLEEAVEENNVKTTSLHHKTNRSHAETFVVNTNVYSENEIQGWKDIQGRRIVDMNYLCKCLLQAQALHSTSCHGVICMEQENYQALFSTLWFKCNVCSTLFKVTSEKPAPKPMLRRAMVWGTLCSGGTYTHTKELLAFCNIPFMAQKTFMSDELEMDSILETARDASLSKAIAEEKEACWADLVARGIAFDKNEPVRVKVSLDGSWAARSYGSRYTSASGCGVIVAENTRKIIWIGCRNKRCSICNRKEGNVMKPHKCFKNYSGASGGMEPEIIIEGFQKLQDANLWLIMITTDGDSTTVSRVKNSVNYGPSIEHQLCCNHISKNCGKKLREIKCPKEVADLVSKNIERITLGIRSAIKHCAEETNGSDVSGLYHDIRNAPSHVFGRHNNCREYFCTKRNAQDTAEEDYVEKLKNCGVWAKIQNVVDGVAAKCDSLKHNKTSNMAENIFTRLCKYNVGKRLNLMGRGSYQRRVWITALQHNEGYKWHDEYMKKFVGCSPGIVLSQFANEQERRKISTVKSKQRPNYSRKPAKSNMTEQDYGEAALAATEELIDFEKEIPTLLRGYTLSEQSSEKTKEVLTTAEMEEFAKGRILPKFAADIIGSTSKTLLKKCQHILLTTTTWNHIKLNKPIVGSLIQNIKDATGYDFRPTHIFIDRCHNFLCCIPDAVSEDASTILIIRKKSVQGLLFDQLKQNKLGLGCRFKDERVILDTKTCNEMQISLHVSGALKSLLVFVNSNDLNDYVIHETVYDPAYFTEKLEGKLSEFFEDIFVREVIKQGILVKN